LQLFAVVIAILLSAGLVIGQSADQKPEQLCKCAGDESVRKGGIASYEAFQKRYRGRFKSAAESQLAWKVYQAANRCNAVMVIGRLADTGGFVGKPGHCVMRGLKDWTVAINDVFIHGGTDRQSRFLLVSQSPMESLGSINTSQVERDRETNWRVIYNHEISEIQKTGRYQLVGQPDTFSPQRPGRFEPKPCADLSGTWSGMLVVREVRGTSNIQRGQSRNASITLDQEGCRVLMRFGGNEIAGYFRPREASTHLAGLLDENIAGSLVSAEILKSPTGPLELTIEQQSTAASIISSGRLSRK
jgi:hypothetical protein